MSDKVVFLAFDNPAQKADGDVYLMACGRCRNKTYRHEAAEGCAAKVYCAACGQYIGKMGWYKEESEA